MRFLAIFGILVAALLNGCASYQMGEPADLPYRAISVAPPSNFSTLPNIEGALNSALRQAILQSGSLELVQPGNQDATLELLVIEAKRDIAAVTAEDVGRGRKFELNIEFELSLKKPGNADDFYIRSRSFIIKQDLFTDSGLVDAEHQAGPEIARQAATKAIEIISDLW